MSSLWLLHYFGIGINIHRRRLFPVFTLLNLTHESAVEEDTGVNPGETISPDLQVMMLGVVERSWKLEQALESWGEILIHVLPEDISQGIRS